MILVTVRSTSVIYHSGNQILSLLPLGTLNRRQRYQMKQIEGEYVTELTVACVSQ